MMAKFKYLLLLGFFPLAAFGQKVKTYEGTVTYLKEVKINLSIREFSNPVEVVWGKIIADKDKVSNRWGELIEVSWFPVTRENMTYDEWISFYDVKSFPKEGFGKVLYDKTKKKYPNAKSFKASKINQFRANQIIFAEVLVDKSHILLLGQYKQDYRKSPKSLNVFGKLLSVDAKGNILHSYKKPVVLEDAIFPATNLKFLENWISGGFAIRGEGGKLILLNLNKNSFLRKGVSERNK